MNGWRIVSVFKTNKNFQKIFQIESSRSEVFLKKVLLNISQISQENTCVTVSFLIKLIKKETLAQLFSCEICEIFKNTFFYRTPLVAASEIIQNTKILHEGISHFSIEIILHCKKKWNFSSRFS